MKWTSADARRRASGIGSGVGTEVGPEVVATALGRLAPVEMVRPAGEEGTFRAFEIRAESDPRTAVAALATEHGWGVRAMEKVVPRLEEAFLAITGTEG